MEGYKIGGLFGASGTRGFMAIEDDTIHMILRDKGVTTVGRMSPATKALPRLRAQFDIKPDDDIPPELLDAIAQAQPSSEGERVLEEEGTDAQEGASLLEKIQEGVVPETIDKSDGSEDTSGATNVSEGDAAAASSSGSDDEEEEEKKKKKKKEADASTTIEDEEGESDE